LHRIAIREGLSLIEKRKRYSSADPDATPEIQNMTASSSLDADKVTALVESAIATLPEKQALVFRLRYYDDQPYEKMSEMLETSVGALKASFHHALKKVEAYLDKHNLM
jgi:RNA polymerase sigma factor (sigma-70 family)